MLSPRYVLIPVLFVTAVMQVRGEEIICRYCAEGRDHALLPLGLELEGRYQYAPDRQVDVLHIKLDVTPDFEARTVAGTASITAIPISKPIDLLKLDAIDINVSEVRCKGAAVDEFVSTRDGLQIAFVDPSKLGVTGGSAGGHLSAYVALFDDAAKPDSKDQIERQSSRVACAVSFAGPTDWTLLETIDHKHPAYRQLIGYEPGTPAEKLQSELVKDVSPISFASADDPPIMQVHGDKDSIVPLKHASSLHEKLESLGVQSELVVIPGGTHGVAGAGEKVTGRATKFVKQYLLTL